LIFGAFCIVFLFFPVPCVGCVFFYCPALLFFLLSLSSSFGC
jgi:hypothetical protein